MLVDHHVRKLMNKINGKCLLVAIHLVLVLVIGRGCTIQLYRLLIATLVSICKMFNDCFKGAASRVSHSGISLFSRLVLATLQQ